MTPGAEAGDLGTDVIETLTTSAEEWVCLCGRSNVAGLSMCPRCGRVPPLGVATQQVRTARSRPVLSAPPRVRALRLAVGVILLNIVFQVVTVALVATGRLETNTAVSLTLWLGFAFYGVVLAMVVGPLYMLRPRWVRGDPHSAGLLGAEVGVAVAGGLAACLWAATGHPVLDPFVRIIVSGATMGRILLAVIAIAVVGPVVEELLFRGVVAESLRPRGAKVAILVSSLLFALAHLRSLAYYTAAGALLGVLYWRRGLKASIAAHVAFNGTLVALAVVVALGPTHQVSANGVSLRAPASWQLASLSRAPAGADIALQGPEGSTLVVQHHALQPAVGVNLGAIASAINAGALPLPPDTTLVPGSARLVTYPVGAGLELSVRVRGHAGEILLVPAGDRVWEVDVATAGSDRAEHDYPGILRSLRLPATS